MTGTTKRKRKNVVPFLDLDENALKAFIPKGVVKNYPVDSDVIRVGEYSDSLFVILSGQVKVYITDESGKEFMFNTIGPGDYFGEVALDGGPRTASIRTLNPCRLFVIPKTEVDNLIGQHPDFARNLIGRLIAKIRNLTDSVHHLALMSATHRLIRYINEHAVQRSDGTRATTPLKQQDIATRIGASREMVSRTLSDLMNCGYIAMDNKSIVVLKALPAVL
jgi:CRP/FNR family cyclic AMP-dependent transcriptional regulator